MTYITAITTAIKHYPIILGGLLTLYVLFKKKNKEAIEISDVICYGAFVFYMTCMLYLVILPLPAQRESFSLASLSGHYQLKPLSFIGDIQKNCQFNLFAPSTYLDLLKERAFYQMIFNIFMFVPLGIFMKFWKGTGRNQSLTIGFMVSFTFEVIQLTGIFGLFAPYRLFDVDDLLVNTFGTYMGYNLIQTLGLDLKYVLNAFAWSKLEKQRKTTYNGVCELK